MSYIIIYTILLMRGRILVEKRHNLSGVVALGCGTDPQNNQPMKGLHHNNKVHCKEESSGNT